MSKQIAAGAAVYGLDGSVAFVRSVALSPSSLEATWLVLTVRDSEHVTAVPTATASVDTSGAVHVPFTRVQLLQAPSVDTVVDAQLASQLTDALGLG